MGIWVFVGLLSMSALAIGGVPPPSSTEVQVQNVPAGADPLSSVGLGTDRTVLVLITPDCCLGAISFYKTLLALPQMDGKARRLVILARDGVMPVGRVLDSANFKPHLLTSGPAAVHEIRDAPTVIVLDPAGKRIGTWTGTLTQSQQGEILAAIRGKSLEVRVRRHPSPNGGLSRVTKTRTNDRDARVQP